MRGRKKETRSGPRVVQELGACTPPVLLESRQEVFLGLLSTWRVLRPGRGVFGPLGLLGVGASVRTPRGGRGVVLKGRSRVRPILGGRVKLESVAVTIQVSSGGLPTRNGSGSGGSLTRFDGKKGRMRVNGEINGYFLARSSQESLGN